MRNREDGETHREKETDGRSNSAYYDIVFKARTNMSSSLYSSEETCWAHFERWLIYFLLSSYSSMAWKSTELKTRS